MNLIDQTKYDGYFCKKCKLIPLIQIIPQESNAKILSSCKCHKQYENIETFIKNKSLKDKIDINEISKESLNEFGSDFNIDINSIKCKYEKAKKELFESSTELKNKLIKLFEDKLKEFNELFNKYMLNNNSIIKVIEQLIKSYELINDNPSNIQNLSNNCIFDNRFKISSLLENFKNYLDDISDKLKNYFKEELIVSSSICKKSVKKEKLTNNFHCAVNNFIEIDKDICAWCSKYKSYITIMNPNKKDSYNLNYTAHIKYVNYIIKSNYNNIISCGEDGFIKIWPVINNDFINKEIKNEENKIIDINLKPLLEYEVECKDTKKIEKMVNIKGDQILGCSSKIIFLFKYVIKENKSELNLINFKEFISTPENKIDYKFSDNILDIVPLKKDGKEIIALCMRAYIHFFTLPNFEFIETISVKLMDQNRLIQINNNEILIIDNTNCLKIIDINNWQNKVTFNNNFIIHFLFKLQDETILYAGFESIKRIFIKTMVNLPDLVELDNVIDYYYDYQYYGDEIMCLSQLKNGTIIACSQNGTIKTFKLYI